VLAAVFEDTAAADDTEHVIGAGSPASSALSAGTQLSRYILGELVGAGGMGLVYAAEDPELHRRVAIKLLRPGFDAEPSHRLRFLREARAMAQLSHPHVVTVYDVGTVGEQSFVVMELVRGGTLREWLRQPRTAAEVLSVFERAGQGLAAAHAAGLVHRDFKPENVLLSDEGRVLVSDFGLARSLSQEEWLNVSQLDSAPKLMGTPLYMAPEQLRGEVATPKSDVFAFSVALYAALYGKPPFWGDTLRDLLEAIERGPPSDSRPRLRVSGRLLRVLLRGLRGDPAARPQLTELLTALASSNSKPAKDWRAITGGALLIGLTGLLGITGWALAGRTGEAGRASGSPQAEPRAAPLLTSSAPPLPVTHAKAAPSFSVPLPASSSASRPASLASASRAPLASRAPRGQAEGAPRAQPSTEAPRDPFMTPLSLSSARRPAVSE
jgi:serine/threonine protein kinase